MGRGEVILNACAHMQPVGGRRGGGVADKEEEEELLRFFKASFK